MSLKNYKYTSTFECVAKVASLVDADRFIAKASLAPLKGLLPADVNPENDPDLLYFSTNGAVAGLVNKNGDSVSNETALLINSSAKNKYVSTDHDRDKVCGVVLFPGFTKFGSNEPLTFEQATEAKEPVNMAFAGVLWKVINPMLAKYIINDEDALAMSWEIAFNSYDIGVGSKNLFDATIIKSDDPKFAVYDNYLKTNKGEGKDPAGQDVFRVIGPDSIILGYSIVPNPAAAVKGILPIENAGDKPEAVKAESDSNINQIPVSQRAYLEQQPNASAGFQICDITMQDGSIQKNIPILGCRYVPRDIDVANIVSIQISEKSIEKNITLSEASVNVNTEKIMKITNVTELESALAKHESVAAVVDFVKAIQQGSEEYAAKLLANENVVKQAELSKEDSDKKISELQASLDKANQKLVEVEEKIQASEEAQKFQERMASFDEEFDLDDEDRKIIASAVKEISDESFAAYMTASKKLMAAKKKTKKNSEDSSSPSNGSKKKKDDSDDDDDNDDDKKDAKASDLVTKAIASIETDKTEKTIVNTVQTETDNTLLEAMGAAFKDSFKLDGKAISSRKNKK